MNVFVTDAVATADKHPFPRNFFQVFEQLEEGFFFFDTSFGIEYLNQKAIEIACRVYNHQPVSGQSILHYISEGRRKGFKKILERVLQGETIEYETQVEKIAVWLHCKYFPSRNEAGVVNGIYGLLKDITAKKELSRLEEKAVIIEQNLFQSRVLFEQFMENSPLASWLVNSNGVMMYMNPIHQKTYGFNQGHIGKTIFELFDPSIAAVYHTNNQEVLKTGVAISTIEKAIKVDGTSQVLKIYKFPLTVDNELMVGGWGVDITEQIELQEKLIKSIERHEYVNEATSEAIYDWDFATHQLYKNTRFKVLFGYTGNNVSPRQRLKHIHPDDRKRFRDVVLKSLRDEVTEKWEIEYRLLHTDGDYKTVVDKAFIIREGQQVKRVIGALQDITAQKALQKKLIEQEKQSKREVVKSIIEAQEKERRQLSVELHDNVNQMLASCKLMLEVAIENGSNAVMLTKKTYQSIQTVINEIRRISHDLSSSAIVDVGLVEAIEQLVERINISGKIKISFQPNKLHYQNDLNEEDKINIYRIIQEQLNNILKHSKAGRVLIRLEVNDGIAKLCIKDDGVGFDMEKCKKGLGLRNIYNRVEYYGGSIVIATASGEGCEMCINLKTSPPVARHRLKIA